MALTLTNSSQAVITQIAGVPDGISTFTLTSGSLPLFSGDSLSADNTTIINNEYTFFGSQNGQISLFIQQGACQIDLIVNGVLISSTDSSSGWVTIVTPVLTQADNISIDLKNEILPPPSQTPTPSVTPSLTPTNTPTNTVTPSITPSITPSETPPSVTPSPTPGSITPQSLGAIFYIDFTDSASVTLSAGTDYVTSVYNQLSTGQTFNDPTSFGIEPDTVYQTNGYDTGKGAILTSGTGLNSTAFTTSVSAHTIVLLTKISSDYNTTLFDMNDGAPRNTKSYLATNDNLRNLQRLSNATNLITNGNNYARGNWDVIIFRNYEDSGTKAEAWINGILTYTGTSATTPATITPTRFDMGGGSSQPLNTNQIAVSIYFDKKLTDTEVQEMFDYMNWKY